MNGQDILIWDLDGPSPSFDGTTILWQSFDDGARPDVLSLPRFVEERADSFRSRYLAWIFELGETVIGGRRVVDHLSLRPGYSFWWSTALAHKPNASDGSPVNDAIKLLALDEVMRERTTRRIVLKTDNDALASAIHAHCHKLGIPFERLSPLPAPVRSSHAKRLYAALPRPLRLVAYMAVYLSRTVPKRRRKRLDGKARITFVDVLVHLKPDAVSRGEFVSNYWTTLVSLFQRNAIRANWLHHYFPQDYVGSPGSAAMLVDRFTSASGETQSHALVESHVSPGVIARALRDLALLWRASRRLGGIRHHFTPAGSRIDLWPLFSKEWDDSLRGHPAVVACLRLPTYERIFHHLPKQERGVYILENQAWELALIHAWKAAGHGPLIGMAHTTVRYWDLRYFYDPRTYRTSAPNALPRPDCVGVNGPAARAAYLADGYPAAELVDVEALRYVHLLNPPSRATSVPRTGRRLLICGDYTQSTSRRMLDWLTMAAGDLPSDLEYLLKPHPAYPVDLSEYRGPELTQTSANIAELLPAVDVVFTSSNSSAAADAYLAGLPVVQMLEGSRFNQSPLRGMSGVVHVTNARELAEAIREARPPEAREPYFCLEEGLPRWCALLGVSPSAETRHTP